MPLDEQSRRLTQFVIGNQQYQFNRLFFGISADMNSAYNQQLSQPS